MIMIIMKITSIKTSGGIKNGFDCGEKPNHDCISG